LTKATAIRLSPVVTENGSKVVCTKAEDPAEDSRNFDSMKCRNSCCSEFGDTKVAYSI
jgi:hypothetical protein